MRTFKRDNNHSGDTHEANINYSHGNGADDSVRIPDLIEIAEEYPFVEFGILLSRGAMGRPRFPSADWLARLIDACAGKGMRFAGHICGAWVKEIMLGNWPRWDFCNIHEQFMAADMYRKFQVNTHAQPHQVDFFQLPFILRELQANGQSVIFQYDGVNGDQLVHRSLENGNTNISTLFDLSHGAGILPESWPKLLPGVPCGYAGGLSPENVAEQLAKLESVIGEGTRPGSTRRPIFVRTAMPSSISGKSGRSWRRPNRGSSPAKGGKRGQPHENG